MRIPFLLYLLVVSDIILAQQKKNFTKLFQFSLTPGISTNGMHPGGYANFFSLNLSSGISAANYLLEIGVISNFNIHESRGLQFAGFANVTGGDAFAGLQPKEIEKKEKEGFEANLSGAQFASVANIVLDNVFGLQTTGGINLARGALQGVQIAGLSNTVLKYSFGLQLAGLYNISNESIDGVQLAALFNGTTGELYGLQAGLINKAGIMDGMNSFVIRNRTAVQLGLFNFCKPMNGYQIGLINIAGVMQGTQIGLVNIYRNTTTAQTRNGTSIGLINIGSSGYVSVYGSDIFPMNFEIATGTIKNGKLPDEQTERQIQNSVIYSSARLLNKKHWALGYGLKKYFFNRTMTPGMNHIRFLAAGVDLMHINHERKKVTKELSLLARPLIRAGSRFHPKNRNFFFFAEATYNFNFSRSGYNFNRLIGEDYSGARFQRWPGFSAGVLIQ